MNWNHIVVEAYCLYKKEYGEIPSCCKYEPGKIGVHCMEDEVDKHKICSYLGFCKARSSLVLTDSSGNALSSQTYNNDDISLSAEEYESAEKDWLDSWKDIISYKVKDEN